MKRHEAIKTIIIAYENKELGFQKGAQSCKYYDVESDSCCVIGILLDIDKMKKDSYGNVIEYLDHQGISAILNKLNAKSLHGLSYSECGELQSLHDGIILGDNHEYEFKDYIYSLK